MPTKKKAAPGSANASRRREILNKAAGVFAEKGFATATVRDVADAAGILSGSLYYHFESKDQMLEEILQDVLLALVENYRAERDAADVKEGLMRLFEVAFEHIVKWPDANAIFQNDFAYLANIPRFAFMIERNREVRKIWIELLERGVAEGKFRQDLDVNLAYLTMMGAIASTVRWKRPRGIKAARELARGMATLFIAGVSSEQTTPRRRQRSTTV